MSSYGNSFGHFNSQKNSLFLDMIVFAGQFLQQVLLNSYLYNSSSLQSLIQIFFSLINLVLFLSQLDNILLFDI